MKSNGGQTLSEVAADRSAELFLSGLAGGVIGGHFFAHLEQIESAVTLDMGGTSTDVGLIVDGDYGTTAEYDLDWGVHVIAPHIDFTCIGAGGGSIAYVDRDGLLKVGPQSAGADPGPACYGRGGTLPTVTDANVVLNRLDPEYFLGGEIALERERAVAALTALGSELGLSAEEAALAVVETVNDNMANAVRQVTIERGLDYREFHLIAFGGAGPLHGAEVAAILGMKGCVVPPFPGLCSAFGTVIADVRIERARSIYLRSDSIDMAALRRQLEELRAQVLAELREEGYTDSPVLSLSVSARYHLQSHEIEIAISEETLSADDPAVLVAAFHEAHQRRFDFSSPGHPIEIVRVAALAIGKVADVALPEPDVPEGAAGEQLRDVWFSQRGAVPTPVYLREQLASGRTLSGPAIIAEHDSTTLVPPAYDLRVGSSGTITLSPRAEPDQVAVSAEPAVVTSDVVTLNVVRNRLSSICKEMDNEALRTAHSPLFSESRDFSCMLFNLDLELISQAENNPAIICAGVNTVPFVVEELGLDFFEEGDVIVHNDPYRGSCHMPEHLMLKGVFHNGELVAFAGIIAHIAEIGGMAPGSFAVTATEVFQEGLRLPPVKIMRRGEYNQDVWRIMLANHRTPHATWGDMHAMLACLKVAERRLPEVIDEYGTAGFTAITKMLIESGERWMRAQISAIPTGVYEFEDCLEDDGVSEDPVYFRATIVVKEDEVVVDYSRSDPQSRGAINLTYVATAAATYTAVLQALNVRDVPLNEGIFRPDNTRRSTGDGALNVSFPGSSVGGNWRASRASSTRFGERWRRRFPSVRRQQTAAPPACCPSAASTRTPASTTRTSTWRAAGGAVGPDATETTTSSWPARQHDRDHSDRGARDPVSDAPSFEYGLRTDSGGPGHGEVDWASAGGSSSLLRK